MRKLVTVVCGCMLGLLLSGSAVLAAEKLAYVDLSKSFSEYQKTKDYDAVLGDKENAYSGERDKKVAEIKQFQDKMSLLSDKEKEAKKTDMETKVKSLQEFDRQKQADLREEQDKKMKEILKDIEDAVKQIAEKEGYTMVFNDRVLVYQTKETDITAKVLEILNKNYKK
jgi:outer membrane protein